MPPSVPILMYHGVSPTAAPRFRPFVVEPRRFEAQMELLASRGYRTCTVSALADVRRSGHAPPRDTVVLTFDDAFDELAVNAFPVLERLGFQATVYVPTAFIGATSTWLADVGEGSRRVLSAEAMRAVPTSVVEFGAHSRTHPHLDVVPDAVARSEIADSRRALEDVLARPVTTFAYPFGHERATTRRLVREAGYTSACRVGYRHSAPGEDPFALSRVPVFRGVDVERFEQLLRSDDALRVRRLAAGAWRPVRQAVGLVSHRSAA